MPEDNLRKRLKKLNRTAVKGGSRGQASASRASSGQALRAIRVPDLPEEVSQASRLRIEDIAPGRVVERPDGGAYWLVERRLSDIACDCELFFHRYSTLLTSEAIILPEGSRRDLAEFVECDPHRVVYLDIETTGLSGRPLFLIGVMEFDGHDFLIRQFFARNYAEERHLLADLAGYLPTFEMMITFNGRSFDVPYMRDRAAVNRLEVGLPPRHFDLLHESRRRWRRWLPNCRLVTLEECICRRRRVDDIPSELIPAAYHEFVHTEDASKMRHVMHHNALDLLTMAELALFMLTGQNDWG